MACPTIYICVYANIVIIIINDGGDDDDDDECKFKYQTIYLFTDLYLHIVT